MSPPASGFVPKRAAAPVHSVNFDPWNSSSSGHQRPDNTPGTGWRESRNKKLNSQFYAGNSGGARLSDTWGAGSEDWDEEKKVLVPKSLKARKGRTVRDLLLRTSTAQESPSTPMELDTQPGLTKEESLTKRRKNEDAEKEAQKGSRRIFDGVIAYVNGSTFPHVSDHRLKHLLSENGGNMSLHLGRRKVTHVILGRPVSSGPGYGAGGGLAGSKLEKEIKRIGGCAVKFVSVEWVLESIKAGKRLPEARFSSMKIAPKGQNSVYGLYTDPSDGPGHEPPPSAQG
ncbi:DNA repair protein REV1 [Paramyrothecium foliicola]|nr:DNA repair protein REV1 [Paramyrothecium foliicola]